MSPGKSLTPVVLLGDSISAGTNQSWFDQANVLAGSPFRVAANAGIAGNTTAQMLARLSTDVYAYSPTYATIEGGGNDGPTASTITNIQAIADSMVAHGVIPIFSTVLPSTSFTTGAQQTAFDNANAWLRAHYTDYSGAGLCDWDAAVRGPGTYQWRAGYDVDGVHPSATGLAVMGVQMAATIRALGLRSWK